MLFACPHCQHENEVPDAELTGEPMVLECGRCHQSFRVVPEETAEEVQALPMDEQTAVGVTYPSSMAEGGAIPSSADFEESDGRTLGEADIEPHTMPISTSAADFRGRTDAEGRTMNAGRPPSSIEASKFEREPEPEVVETLLNAPAGERETSDRTLRRSAAPRPARSEAGPQVTVTPARSSGDVYARISQGEGVSVVPVPVSKGRERPPTKAWNEASVVHVSESKRPSLSAFVTRLVAQLERAPLFLRVWLAVFPLALGLILIFAKRSPEEAVPIAIPAQAPLPLKPVRAVQLAPVEGAEAVLAPPTEEPEPEPEPETTRIEAPTESRAALAPSLGFDDPESPPGTAFVKQEGVRLRTHPGSKGKLVAPLPVGAQVRTYEDFDEWILVMALPRGPAGFIKKEALDSRKPLAVIARELAFLGCTAAGSSMSACIDDAERQLEGCLAGCTDRERCEQACRLAHASCLEGCKKR